MSSSFNSEIMDDELSTVLLNLTPDDPRYTSLEGWLDLTPEAQATVQLRYADQDTQTRLTGMSPNNTHVYPNITLLMCVTIVTSLLHLLICQ